MRTPKLGCYSLMFLESSIFQERIWGDFGILSQAIWHTLIQNFLSLSTGLTIPR